MLDLPSLSRSIRPCYLHKDSCSCYSPHLSETLYSHALNILLIRVNEYVYYSLLVLVPSIKINMILFVFGYNSLICLCIIRVIFSWWM